MRRMSKKMCARVAECAEYRRGLVKAVGRCELCGYTPNAPRRGKPAMVLHVHEIARGIHRSNALDKPYAVLVVCAMCHMGPLSSRAAWPEPRQLAALKRSRPQDYDLEAYNTMVGRGPNRIVESEVEAWLIRKDR